MKKLSIILIMASLFACQSPEIPVPDATVTCAHVPEMHPKQDAYQNLLDSMISDDLTGINLLIDHPTDGMWKGSAGYADIEADIPMTPCHIHFAASLIKTYIGVLILQLQEEGKLALDDKLGEHISADILKRLPNGNEFTIRQLLQCRSGMPDVFEASFLLDLLNAPTRQYTMEELIKYLYGVKPIAAPGKRYYYGDGNFILLSMIIEKLDGPLPESYQKRIFDPLGMTQSSLVDNLTDLPNHLPESYWDRYGNGQLENVSDMQIALATGLEGTDGLFTNTSDMYRFMQGLVDGTLINSDSYAEMLEVIDIPEGDSQQNYAGYGLGIAKIQLSGGEIWYGSFGNHIGSAQMMMFNPVHQTTHVIAQNTGTFFNDREKQRFFNDLILKVEAIAFQ
ncbi:MAG: serine hydrolase [Bacteroidota bacterium]